MESAGFYGGQLEYAHLWNGHVRDGKNEPSIKCCSRSFAFFLFLFGTHQSNVQLGASYLYRAGGALGERCLLFYQHDRAADPRLYYFQMEKDFFRSKKKLSPHTISLFIFCRWLDIFK